MAAGTPVLRLLATFSCPALVYTSLITFRWVTAGTPLPPGAPAFIHLGGLTAGGVLGAAVGASGCPSQGPECPLCDSKEAPLRPGPEAVQELDGLDSERSLLGSR